MQYRSLRFLGSFLPVVLAAVGCSSPKADMPDVNRPVVIKGPPVIIASDTAKPDTMGQTREWVDFARMTHLQPDYAVAVAAATFGDRKTLHAIYAPNVELETPDGKFSGVDAVAGEMISFARRISLLEIRRAPEVTLLLADSIVSDSGAYAVVVKRGDRPALHQQGAYAAKWRMRPPGGQWLLLTDRLYPPTKDHKAPSRSTPKKVAK